MCVRRWPRQQKIADGTALGHTHAKRGEVSTRRPAKAKRSQQECVQGQVAEPGTHARKAGRSLSTRASTDLTTKVEILHVTQKRNRTDCCGLLILLGAS